MTNANTAPLSLRIFTIAGHRQFPEQTLTGREARIARKIQRCAEKRQLARDIAEGNV